MALVDTLGHHPAAFLHAKATKVFWEIAVAHHICSEVHYPGLEFSSLAGGDWVHHIPRPLAALGLGIYNPTACPRAAHV